MLDSLSLDNLRTPAYTAQTVMVSFQQLFTVPQVAELLNRTPVTI